MTDKQIIIDGIDVGGCIYYEDGKCLNGEMVQCSCKKVAVCYYKEYKRKEQECEGLRYEIGSLENDRDILQEQLDRLKAEVKSKTEYIQEQRDIINQYSKEIEVYKKCQGKRASKREEELKAENEELKRQHQGDKGLITSTGKMNYQLLQEYDKLKTTLTEIKEIAEQILDDDDNHCPFELTQQILQKVSECEGNNE